MPLVHLIPSASFDLARKPLPFIATRDFDSNQDMLQAAQFVSKITLVVAC